MRTSFPIPESVRGNKVISHPYFTLSTFEPDNQMPVGFEWQIHPARDGLLRYTLVQEYENQERRICAIYHHAGWETSLLLGYSEGVLLLSESQADTKFETLVVASLLGILIQLRMLGICTTRRGTSPRFKRILQHPISIFNQCAK